MAAKGRPAEMAQNGPKWLKTAQPMTLLPYVKWPTLGPLWATKSLLPDTKMEEWPKMARISKNWQLQGKLPEEQQ